MKHYTSFSQMAREPYQPSSSMYTPVNRMPVDQAYSQQAQRIPRHMKHARMQDQYDDYYAREQQQMDMMENGGGGGGERAAEPSCKQIVRHLERCKACAKLYKRNTTQGALIIFLVFVIIILLTRLMDK
jgi:hypothetical protein